MFLLLDMKISLGETKESHGLWESHGQPTPRNDKALIRAYEPLVSLNKALLRPYFWGGYVKGGRFPSEMMYLNQHRNGNIRKGKTIFQWKKNPFMFIKEPKLTSSFHDYWMVGKRTKHQVQK